MRHSSDQSHDTFNEWRPGVSRLDLLVLVATVMLLGALGFMQLSNHQILARITQSKNNLADLGKAMKHYEGSGRGNVRPAEWEKTLSPYLEHPEEVMNCPLDANGGHSYALYTGVERFGARDSEKIAIVTSDDRLIDIETKTCADGSPVVTGNPVARAENIALALMYGGNVRAFEIEDMMPDDNITIVTGWLPERENNTVCGEVFEKRIRRSGVEE